MSRIRLDIRDAYRSLSGRPWSTLAALVVLIIGIALAVVIFALTDRFIFAPLPYHAPERLSVLTLRPQRFSLALGAVSSQRPTPRLSAFEQTVSGLTDGVTAFRAGTSLRLHLNDRVVALKRAEVSANFFAVLGLPISPRELTGQRPLPLILTTSGYRQLFGYSAPSTLDMPVVTSDDATAFRVTKVLPDTFLFPSNSSLADYGAITLFSSPTEDSAATSLVPDPPIDGVTIVARLRPQTTSADLKDAVTRLVLGDPSQSPNLSVMPLRKYMTARTKSLAVGAALMGLLIIILCTANVSLLFLARGLYAARDIATRTVLGATRLDTVRLIAIECTMLALIAVALGTLLSWQLISAFRIVIPARYAILGRPYIDHRALAVALLIGVLLITSAATVSWLFGTSIAVRRGVHVANRRMSPIRYLSIFAQSTVCMLLTTSAMLLGSSYLHLVNQDTGYSKNPILITVSYPDSHAGPRLQRDVDAGLQALRRAVGVRAVAASIGPMLDDTLLFGSTTVDGHPVAVTPQQVTPNYFESLGIRLVAGRLLDSGDVNRSVVINTTFAHRYWPNGVAIGRYIEEDGKEEEVVGIVSRTFDVSLDRAPQPTSYSLIDDPDGCVGNCNNVNYIVTPGEYGTHVTAAAIRAIEMLPEHDGVIISTDRLSSRLADSIKGRTFNTLVVGLFAASSVAVCVLALFAMVSFIVAQRRHEFAVRLALGARSAQLLTLAARESLTGTIAGVAFGALASYWNSGVMRHIVYDVSPDDPIIMLIAGLFMLALAAISSLIPAQSVLDIDPADLLRHD